MALISWTDVVALAPDLSAVSAGGQAEVLAVVALQVGAAEWGDLAATGQLYLARHLGILALRALDTAGPVTSESVGSVSVGYGLAGVTSNELGSTNWGREFARIRRLLPCTYGAVVI